MPQQQPLDADRLHRHQRRSEHMSMLESASMAGDGTATDDEDAVSLAYLSQHSPSDVGSVAHYQPQANGSELFYDGDYEDSRHAAARRATSPTGTNGRGSKRSSLSSLRYSGAQHGASAAGVRIGLVANFAALGAVHGLVTSAAYPFLKIYLNMDEHQAYAADRWLALPWMCKCALAFAADALCGLSADAVRARRKRLVLLTGWAWCLLCALVVVLLPSAEPYADDRGAVVNGDAAAAGGKYVAMLTLAAFGYVFASAVCDGLMVQLAHKHCAPTSAAHESGGRASIDSSSSKQEVQLARKLRAIAVVTTLQATKLGAQALATLLVALLCNSAAYGGSFGWSPAIRGVFVLVLAVAVAAIAATWFCLEVEDEPSANALRTQTMMHSDHMEGPELHDEGYYEDENDADDEGEGRFAQMRASAVSLWRFVHQRAVWQIILFIFITRVGFSYYASSAKALYEFWLDVSPLMSNIFSSVHLGVYALVALSFHKSQILPSLSFKRVMVAAVAGSGFSVLLLALFSVFGVVRSPVLTLAFEQLTSGFEALAYFVALLLAVHVCEPSVGLAGARTRTSASSNSATKYNLVLALGNLGVPFAVSLSQSVGAHFDVFDSEYTQDTKHARAQVMYCFLVALVVKMLALVALPLLPQPQDLFAAHAANAQATQAARARARASELQKQEQEQAQVVGSKLDKLPALAVVGVTGLLLLWATLMTLLASFETTACLTVAGGEGC